MKQKQRLKYDLTTRSSEQIYIALSKLAIKENPVIAKTVELMILSKLKVPGTFIKGMKELCRRKLVERIPIYDHPFRGRAQFAYKIELGWCREKIEKKYSYGVKIKTFVWIKK
jgi:hypothetical protein